MTRVVHARTISQFQGEQVQNHVLYNKSTQHEDTARRDLTARTFDEPWRLWILLKKPGHRWTDIYLRPLIAWCCHYPYAVDQRSRQLSQRQSIFHLRLLTVKEGIAKRSKGFS